ncbi:reticulophagy regulator 2 [Lepisosteus oculatus]|uniref:reticulophagy regulator 2 n=1 Tax=Lepisosteus oculatus TaxID=7918 RepID=UPI0035F5182A
MASGEEVGAAVGRDPFMSSSTDALEALFPAGEAERAAGDGSPELRRLRERLQGLLAQYELAVLWVQRLLVWERPLHSIVVACTLNGVFWLLSSTTLRPLFLLSLSLLGLVLLERWKDKLPAITVRYPEASGSDTENIAVHPRLLSVPELSHHLAESYLTCSLYIQEMLQYKRLNHGKFCAMMCAGCSILAVVGHYIPGIMISYIILLSVLLWPLVVYHELIQKMYTGLEPILMKLDYSMKGGTQHRKHEKKKMKKEPEGSEEALAETESESEEELSCFSPTVDVKTAALALAITDSELSDEEASILESGGFSVSRATTPQLTDVSEDLDQQSMNSEPEETFSKDLPEFPSVDEYTSIEQGSPRGCVGQQLETALAAPPGPGEQSPAGFLIQSLASPLHFVNTHFNGHGRPPGTGEEAQGQGLSLEALSEEIVSTAISTVVQNTLSALLRSSEASEGPSIAEFLPPEPQTPLTETDLKEETESPAHEATAPGGLEEEDFELLDQRELDQMDAELGLSSELREEEQELTVAQPTETPSSCPQTEDS